MRRAVQLAAVALLASFAAAPVHAAKRPLTFSMKLVQEETLRHHIPPGHAHDTFSTTLKLSLLGDPQLCGTRACGRGTMRFEWGPLKGICKNAGVGCNGTTDIETLTELPGGTISAGGEHISLSRGIVVPIRSGTGIFKGTRGEIQIAPAWSPRAVFDVILPR